MSDVQKQVYHPPTAILTYTGKLFDLADPQPEMFDIIDVAHALSQICRFTGHVEGFYSVAQHSILASRWFEREGFNPEVIFQALMHDCSEAYAGDSSRPLKKACPALRKIHDDIMDVASQAFGFAWPMYPEVREIDDELVCAEGEALFPQHVQRDEEGHLPGQWPVVEGMAFESPLMSPESAEQSFLAHYSEAKEKVEKFRRQQV